MSQVLTNLNRIQCEPLIESARIKIYRENAFRVTGLPVGATPKEISKHTDKLKVWEEFGVGEETNPTAFALQPAPSIDCIRDALQRLKDPDRRLIDEFFWFWPEDYGERAKDPAIGAIAQGNSTKAYELWVERENDPDRGFIAQHNIAVMFHLVALDWTLYQLAVDVDEEHEEKIKGYWHESRMRWEKIATADGPWEVVKARIRSLDDPRLTTGFAERMRNSLPDALRKLHAEAALRFAEQERLDWAQIHVDFMNDTSPGVGDVGKTAELVLTPRRNRILQHIKAAKGETESKPAKGADAVRGLIAEYSTSIALFELFHGEHSHQKKELFDELAIATTDCLVSYQKETGDNEVFVALLKESLQFATSNDVRQRIQGNIAIGENNIRGKALEPVYNTLREIRESKVKAIIRLERIKREMMPQLLVLSEQQGDQRTPIHELSDALAIVLRGISVDAHNEDKDIATASEAIRLASALAKDPELKVRIEVDLGVVRETVGDATCPFCGSRAGAPQRKITVAMHKVTERVGNGVRYVSNKVSLPRCEECYKHQNRHWKMMSLGAIGGAIVGAFVEPWAAIGGAILVTLIGGGWLFIKAGPIFSRVPFIALVGIGALFSALGECVHIKDVEVGRMASLNMAGGAIVGGLAIFLIFKQAQRKQSPKNLAALYPPVASLLKEGWSFGEKPHGVS